MTERTDKHWQCEDCDWPWPLPGKPPVGSECDNCGGEMTQEDGSDA